MQLHYDHMVLVDYLISKDVGVHCAQYLLRLVAILDFFFAYIFRIQMERSIFWIGTFDLSYTLMDTGAYAWFPSLGMLLLMIPLTWQK